MEETTDDADGPVTTAEDRELFMQLAPARRQQLVRAITVDDAAP
ncbi:hypothetical protein [Streptomyces rubiginosohelvolus]|nr:hypothetical protein OG475_34695 [Streptomyces rubiginosohelvolus]